MPEAGYYLFQICESTNNLRLDIVISRIIPDCSRAYASKLISSGNVSRVSGDAEIPFSYALLFRKEDEASIENEISKSTPINKTSHKTRAGECILVAVPKPDDVSFEPEPIDIDVIYNDSDIAVINKKPGMVVHPAPGHYSETLVNALMYRFPDITGIGGESRPGIVHRLDKDTSGIIVIAKNDRSHKILSLMFKNRTIQKTYLAVTYGRFKERRGTIDYPIGRHPTDRKKMSILSARPRFAVTEYSIIDQFENAALVEVDLKTGRTHQIRVHFSAINHPLLGDAVYGNKNSLSLIKKAERQMLHAYKISFSHPTENRRLDFTAPVPEDMAIVLNELKQQGERNEEKQ